MSTEQRGEEWGRILASLDGRIMSNAPSCERLSLPSGWGWRLGGAILYIETVQATQRPVPITHPRKEYVDFRYRFSFTVNAYSRITISYPADPKTRGYSHSLWHCDAQAPGAFMWYEVDFTPSSYPIHTHLVQDALDPEEASKKLEQGLYNVRFMQPMESENLAERWIRLLQLKTPV